MNLKRLSDQELDLSLGKAIKFERKVLTDIIDHIVEVERRKLYLTMNYSSLFAYLTVHHKYSNGTAQRRIDAARLLKDFPSLPEKIQSGDLNLGQLHIVQKGIRQKKATVSKSEKTLMLENILGKSEKETEILVAQSLDLEIKEAPKVIHQKDESVRLEVTLTKEQFEKLERMRDLLSNSLPDGSWDQVLEYVSDKVIQNKTKVTQRAKPSEKHLKETTKKIVLNRDKSCQICGSKWKLQVDHIHPKWDGGSNDLTNLRILCGRHNRQRYREQAGLR